ncbi:MAG TPA: hypothetical protein VHE14_09655 [Solirubrobacteraceae bacterium]|nr:hypothetical protein [Solirubrobacteraceae bacterium]
MIVRIATEGQYELGEQDRERFEQLDLETIKAVEAGDEAEFQKHFDELLGFVRSAGIPVGDDHLGVSELILPPPDTTLAEAAEEFSGEGLLPH